jgi:hypothetical protein
MSTWQPAKSILFRAGQMPEWDEEAGDGSTVRGGGMRPLRGAGRHMVQAAS